MTKREALLPWQVWEFTEPEIVLLLEDDDRRTPTGATNLDNDEVVIAEATRWQRMTPLQRLEEYQW